MFATKIIFVFQMLRAVKTAAEKQHAAARIVVLSMFPEYMRHSLVDAVVPVVEHDVAGDERRVDGVGDQHVYRRVAYEHLGDPGHVSHQHDQHEGEALALSCAADP